MEDINDHFLNMKNEAFFHQHQRICFIDAFSHVINRPDDDPSVIPMSGVKICKSCAVLLESAYVLRKMSENGEQLFQHYCHCCQLENNEKNGRFLNMNTEVFVHNNKSITFTDGFSAVNNYSIEDSDKILNSKTNLCENCAVQLESAFVFQKMCRAAADILHPKYSPTQPDCKLNQDERQDEGNSPAEISNHPRTIVASFSEQRTLRSRSKAVSKVIIVEKPQPRKRKIDKKSQHMKRQPNSETQKVILSYGCKKCPKKFKNKIGLETHRRIMHRGVHSIRDLYWRVSKRPVQQTQSYSCADCGNTFKKEKYLSQHTRKVHLKRAKPNQKKRYTKNLNNRYECKLCEKTFKASYSLKLHNDYTHLMLRYRCEKCPNVYRGKTGLREHFQSEHMNILFACQDCPKTFKTSKTLTWHKNSAHLKTLMKCKQCHSAYSCPTVLRRHVQKVHKAIHACPHCDKSYKRINSLSTHILDFHIKRPSKCKYCSKDFITRKSLNYHIKYTHEITEYKCEECPKVYKERYLLVGHVEIAHQNIRRFACENCDKRFASPATLRGHNKTQHDL
jgi:hypothetical protein